MSELDDLRCPNPGCEEYARGFAAGRAEGLALELKLEASQEALTEVLNEHTALQKRIDEAPRGWAWYYKGVAQDWSAAPPDVDDTDSLVNEYRPAALVLVEVTTDRKEDGDAAKG